jgi:hypothetical protein
MNTLTRLSPGLVLLVAVGCSQTADPLAGPRDVVKPNTTVESKKSLFARNVYFEKKGDKRLVILSAAVAHQPQAFCEFFLCRTNSNEYESVLVADVEPVKVHEALIAAGANSGSPVKFDPFRPPTGDRIKVTLVWQEKGLEKRASAQSWLRDRKNGEEMKADWVFAGSQFLENPLDAKRPVYAADREGIVMSLANFESAVLDVSIESARLRAEQSFEAFDEHIPPVGTKVSVIMEPMGK